ncbi:hypothetical protein SAY87_021742 [Trapa incisa]|uniref:Uncharacterized protein n=1 Tax=Trapa incisa TaxID=236973 RepID=A0AAN7PS82_9MYRT|nr:hypothetical protein SAY87_021742 [Trapa incisa]
MIIYDLAYILAYIRHYLPLRDQSKDQSRDTNSRQKYRGGKWWRCTRKGDRNPAQVDPPEVAGRQAHPQAGRWLHLASLLSGGIPRVVIDRRLQDQLCFCWDSDGDSLQCPVMRQPPDMPKGHLAVYVGEELWRFVILTGYLRNPLFKVLLEKAEEEFGFDHTGGLTIPCEIETFKYLLKCMENHTRADDACALEDQSYYRVNLLALDGVGKSKKTGKRESTSSTDRTSQLDCDARYSSTLGSLSSSSLSLSLSLFNSPTASSLNTQWNRLGLHTEQSKTHIVRFSFSKTKIWSAGPAGGVEEGTYCVWKEKAAEEATSKSDRWSEKSNSTGISRRWRFRDLDEWVICRHIFFKSGRGSGDSSDDSGGSKADNPSHFAYTEASSI